MMKKFITFYGFPLLCMKIFYIIFSKCIITNIISYNKYNENMIFSNPKQCYNVVNVINGSCQNTQHWIQNSTQLINIQDWE